MKKINLDTWERKALYENFIQIDDPFFNISADIEVTPLKEHCSRHLQASVHDSNGMLKSLCPIHTTSANT